MTDRFSPIERNSIAVFCVFSLLLFFFPLPAIRVPSLAIKGRPLHTSTHLRPDACVLPC